MNKTMTLIVVALLLVFVSGAVKSSKNNQHVYWIITASINEGQLANVRELGKEMVAATRRSEPGTLAYDWSVSADGKTVFFYEHYEDSAAVMVHTTTFGEKFAPRLLPMIEIQSFEIFGNPNDEVRAVYTKMGAKFNKSIDGFQR